MSGVCAGDMPYATFLTERWFERAHASDLRGHIRNLILELVKEQKRVGDDHSSMVAVAEGLRAYNQQLCSKSVMDQWCTDGIDACICYGCCNLHPIISDLLQHLLSYRCNKPVLFTICSETMRSLTLSRIVWE